MRIFEFHFNPKGRQNYFLHADSFEYKSQKELSQESMYFAGELLNALPQNSRLLKDVANIAKEEYAASKEQRFKKTLSKVNEFLAKEVKAGNVDWVGNVHAGIVSFSQLFGSKSTCFFTKAGGTRIFLARKGSLVDIDKNVQDFQNMGSGHVFPNDKIVMLTPEVFRLFSEHNILHDLLFFTQEQQFKELLKAKSKELSAVSGLMLVALVEPLGNPKKRKRPLVPLFVSEWAFSFPLKKEVALIGLFLLFLFLGFFLFR